MTRPLFTPRFALFLGLSTGTVAGFFVGVTLSLAAAPAPSAYPHLQVLAEVYSRIRASYVLPIPSEKLVDAAARGMVAELDPHSTFMNPDQFRAYRDDNRGQYVGVGLEIRLDEAGKLAISRIIAGGPAAEAGFEVGDVIEAIDDEATEGWTTEDAVKRLRGPRGVKLNLTILREVEGAPVRQVLAVTRDVVHTEPVRAQLLAPGIGAVEIGSFQANVGEKLRAAIDDLESRNQAELQGLVLDLRGNPGGLLSEAVSVADAFLDDGLIVRTQGRDEAAREEYTAHRTDTRFRGPLVVLVNGSSASASEVVTAALQETRRAIVMGTQSYGKASVQSITELPEGYGMKITTSLYFGPSGRSLQNDGITPDIVVPAAEPPAEQSDRRNRREKDLEGALANPDATPRTPKATAAISDYQLRTAADQLMAIIRFATRPQ